MKKIIFVAIFLICLFRVGKARADQATPTTTPSGNTIEPSGNTTTSFDLLLPPSNPSLYLLGKNITSIDKPETPVDLKTAVINGFNDYQSGQNFAAEIAPAWIFFGSDISYDSFIDNDPFHNISQSFTLSFAEGIDPSGNSTTAFSTAAHFSIFRGDVDPKFLAGVAKVKTLIQNDIDVTGPKVAVLLDRYDYLKSFNKTRIFKDADESKVILYAQYILKIYCESITATDETNNPVLNLTGFKQLLSNLVDNPKMLNNRDTINEIKKLFTNKLFGKLNTNYTIYLASNNKRVANSLSGLTYQRLGFKFDVYGGLLWDVPRGIPVTVQNSAVWATVGWDTIPNTNWSILGLGRYLQGNNWELGTQLTWNVSTIWSLSGEFTAGLNSGSSYKYDLVVDYKTSNSQTLSFVFGSDNTNYGNNFLALASISLGFGNTRPAPPATN